MTCFRLPERDEEALTAQMARREGVRRVALARVAVEAPFEFAGAVVREDQMRVAIDEAGRDEQPGGRIDLRGQFRGGAGKGVLRPGMDDPAILPGQRAALDQPVGSAIARHRREPAVEQQAIPAGLHAQGPFAGSAGFIDRCARANSSIMCRTNVAPAGASQRNAATDGGGFGSGMRH